MAPTIQSGDEFVCPKTKEKMNVDACIWRYVTANTLQKKIPILRKLRLRKTQSLETGKGI